jgi:membrane-associated phospholipid phosphatase
MSNPDLALLRLMRTRGHAPAAERTAKAIAAAGEWGAVWAAIGLSAATFDPPRRSRWLGAAALAPAAIGLNFAVKLAVRRQRPKLDGLPPLGGAPTSLSFPSAHATASFASAAAMSRIAPGRGPLLYAGAAVMGLTRPYLGMHYPSDVIAGAALGTVLGKVVGSLLAGQSGPPHTRHGGSEAGNTAAGQSGREEEHLPGIDS